MAGQASFKRAVFGVLPRSHVVAIAALITLVPASFMMPALALIGTAVLAVVGVAVWEALSGGRGLLRRHVLAGQPHECGLFTAMPSRFSHR